MPVNGCDCSVIIKTAYRAFGVPYAEETLREAVLLLVEEAAIEGDGCCRAIRKSGGVTGCVVTPLTIGTAPLLLYLAMGNAGLPVFVSETKNVYQYRIDLVPMEGGACFDLVQERGGERRLFENCRVKGFELRCKRGETWRQAAIHLKIDIRGVLPPVVYPYAAIPATETGERFSGDGVSYRINGREYTNIYGCTLSVKRAGGTKTELWIKRALAPGSDLPGLIEEMTITAQLLRDAYEYRYFGTFRITMKRLVLIADETAVDCADGVIGPLRYYAAGTVCAEVFTATGETIA